MERSVKLLTSSNFIAGSQSILSQIKNRNSKIHNVSNILMLFIISFLNLRSIFSEPVSPAGKKYIYLKFSNSSGSKSLSFLSVKSREVNCKIRGITHSEMKIYFGVTVCPSLLLSVFLNMECARCSV